MSDLTGPTSSTPSAEAEKPTKLKQWRVKRGATQADMVRDTGIPMSTYQRIEEGKLDRPHYPALYNCAVVLEVEVTDLIEDEFLSWWTFHQSAKKPPETPSWHKPQLPPTED